jgi:hypothetical protein
LALLWSSLGDPGGNHGTWVGIRGNLSKVITYFFK